MNTHYPKYDKYKKTDIEWLPEVPAGWEVKKITHTIKYHVGFTPDSGNSLYYGNGYDWANISDLGVKWLEKTEKQITEEAVRHFKKKMVPKRSLLYSFKLTVGVVSFTANDIYTNEAIAAFQEGGVLNLDYFYYLAPLAIIQNASENIYGAKILNQESIGNAKIILPPFPQQKAIADFLDKKTEKIDALITKLDRQTELLKEYRISLITITVTKGLNPNVPMKKTGIEWLPEVPAGWGVKRLRFVLNTNPNKPQFTALPSSMASFVPMDAIGIDGTIKLDIEKPIDEIGDGYTYFAENDVVLAKITPCFENSKGALAKGLTNSIAFGTTELHVLRASKQLEPSYLWFLTITYPFRKIGESTMYGAGGHKRVPEDFIKDFIISLPLLSEQQAISAFLDNRTEKIDMLTTKLERQAKLLKEYRMSLITSAVTGQIKVTDN